MRLWLAGVALALLAPIALAQSLLTEKKFFTLPSYTTQGGKQIRNVRVGYETDRFELAAFVRNLTNDRSAVSGIDFNNLTAMVNEPRVWGVAAGVKF